MSKPSRRYGINRKTVAKWKRRTSSAASRPGPQEPRSTVPPVEEETIMVVSAATRSRLCAKASSTSPSRSIASQIRPRSGLAGPLQVRFPMALIAVVPHGTHTAPTDNGIPFHRYADRRERQATWPTCAAAKPLGIVRPRRGIPGPMPGLRMNRPSRRRPSTPPDDDHARSEAHLVVINAYNFGCRLKTPRGPTLYQYICKYRQPNRKGSTQTRSIK